MGFCILALIHSKFKALKNKGINISISVIIIILIAIVFLMGYRLPQRDKHKDWVFVPENKDSFFEIEKTNLKIDFVLSIPNYKGYIVLLKDGDYIRATAITEKGKTIKQFPKTKDFYIDSLNHRLIFSKEIYKSDTLFKKQLIGYHLSDHKKIENLEIKDFTIEETLDEFLKRKNFSVKDFPDDDDKKILDNAYLTDKTVEANFYKTLYPVTKISIAYEALDTEFYTNKDGELYNVEKTRINTDNINNIWDSLYSLFPNYKKSMNAHTLNKEILTYKEVDTPTRESNFVHTHFLNISFRQNYIKYFQIPFGNKNFNFKVKEKTFAFPKQLNIPRNTTDTLGCIINDELYWIYAKTNKIGKKVKK